MRKDPVSCDFVLEKIKFKNQVCSDHRYKSDNYIYAMMFI